MNDRRLKGQAAEALAVRFLKARGFKIISQNFRVKSGELDILAREGETLCLVEVRSHGKDSPYLPEASFPRHKKERLRRASATLLQRYGLFHVPVRLDLLVIDWQTGEPEYRFYPGGVRE